MKININKNNNNNDLNNSNSNENKNKNNSTTGQRIIKDYVINKLIGKGGFAEVY
jgi:hypothetical protein